VRCAYKKGRYHLRGVNVDKLMDNIQMDLKRNYGECGHDMFEVV
jgi:hypothetical protein